MNVPSADISQFIIKVQYDLSGATPQVCMTPESVGPNEALVEYIYEIITPSGVIVYQGDFTAPDSTGNGDTFCHDLPLFNNQVEWGGGQYIVKATMKDTANLQFSYDTLTSLCPPAGNDKAGGNFGKACMAVEVKCASAELVVRDSSNYEYKGYVKTLISRQITVVFPADPSTGIQPPPISLPGMSAGAVTIAYNGEYNIIYNSVYSYAITNDVTVLIKYTTLNKNTGKNQIVEVSCYANLCPLLCEWAAFIKETEDLCGKDEVKYVENQRIISIVSAKILQAIMMEKCGKPTGPLIHEIKKITGFTCNCDCDGIPSGALISTYQGGTLVFEVVNSCGDVVGAFSNPSPNNYLLTLSDISYVFNLGQNASDNGFTVTPTLVGCVKTYTLDVDLLVLTTNILAQIGAEPDLQAAFCSLVSLCDPFDIFATVDMKCVYPALVNQCDYFGELLSPHHPSDTFKGIQVNGVWYFPPTTLVYSNQVQINLWLQTLGFGFGATDYALSGVSVALTTLANVNSITSIAFTDSSTLNDYSILVASSNCATVPVTGSAKMQAVIDTLCNIFNALYGISPVLYKVKVDGSDTTPDYLGSKVVSSDGSVIVNVLGENIDLRTLLKVNASDTCPGYLLNKVVSDKFVVSNKLVAVTSYDYVITVAAIGATRYVQTIVIDGVTYTINVLTTDLSGLETALNALGLGTFVCTSPSSNLVITSLGNIYNVELVIVENTVGPTYVQYNSVQSNPASAGTCAKLSIEPKTRTWTQVTIDGVLWIAADSTVEYASLDSFDNVMLNIDLVPDAGFTVGTSDVNPTDLLPASVRPRTTQKIPFQTGWDGVSANATNYFIINTSGLIQVEIGLGTSDEMRVDSIYYPTN